MNPRSDIHERVLTATTTDALMDIYGVWSKQYDQDLTQAWGYPAPERVVQQVQRYAGVASARILDAGCGTGLVGQLLHTAGFKTLDGLDFSAGMLLQAKQKKIYKNLLQGDMNQPLPIADGVYDVTTCAGTFTASHVKPKALYELVRVTRVGGWVVFTVRDTYWVETRFDQIILDLCQTHTVRLHELRTEQYIREEQSECKLLVLEVLAVSANS